MFPKTTKCRQLFHKQNMLAIDPIDGTAEFDAFMIPSACACQIADMDFYYKKDEEVTPVQNKLN